jgi:hypothetical protein
VKDARADDLAGEQRANALEESAADLRRKRLSETFNDGKFAVVESEW